VVRFHHICRMNSLVVSRPVIPTLTAEFGTEVPAWFAERFGTEGTPGTVAIAHGAYARFAARILPRSAEITASEILHISDEVMRMHNWATGFGLAPHVRHIRGSWLMIRDNLIDEIEILDHELPDDFDGPMFAYGVFAHRDELESLAWVLARAMPGCNVREELRLLDEHIAPWIPFIQELSRRTEGSCLISTGDEWQQTVARAEPDAWWVFPR